MLFFHLHILKNVSNHRLIFLTYFSSCGCLRILGVLTKSDKLKDLGNSILGNFGLSLDNFKTVKDPKTGSYNIQFEQK